VPDGAADGLQDLESARAAHNSARHVPRVFQRGRIHAQREHVDLGKTYTHAKGTAKVIEDDKGAGIASVVHDAVSIRASMYAL
jgi:hypothetical protein